MNSIVQLIFSEAWFWPCAWCPDLALWVILLKDAKGIGGRGWEQSPGHSGQPDVSRGPYGATKSGWRTLISPRSVHEERQAELMQKPESTPARKSECAYIELA